MSPKEALDRAIMAAVVSSRAFVPGIIVEKLPRKVREALKELTSEDTRDWRIK